MSPGAEEASIVSAPAAPVGVRLDARCVSILYAASLAGQHVLAVEGVDLGVREGEIVCLVGPSGCGKTTFLNAVAGFLPVSDGELLLDGRHIGGPGPDRAMVFQQPNLLPWRTVLRNVTYGLEMAGIARGKAAEGTALELLGLVGLADFSAAYPATLSGGMQQRVNLARALAVGPTLLLLDEPFASVDAQTRETLQGELLRICAETHVTALFVTHDVREAVYLGDRVCVFSARPGRIVHTTIVDLPKPRPAECRRDPYFLSQVDEVVDALVAGRRGTGMNGGGADD